MLAINLKNVQGGDCFVRGVHEKIITYPSFDSKKKKIKNEK